MKRKRVDEVVFVAVHRKCGTVVPSTISLDRKGPFALMRSRSPFATTHGFRIARCRLTELPKKRSRKP